MECQKCNFVNREGVLFCEECGENLEIICPDCEGLIPFGRNYCGECGFHLKQRKKVSETESLSELSSQRKTNKGITPIVGERKQVTVLFSDITGYTVMCERLDPEEVKEITSQIFCEISKIVVNYDGFIEKFVGDAVMAIFGIPQAHEDDPIRAIKAAREIHQLVDSISLKVENRIGQSISMHSGINTGLVVTGEVNMERGTHGVAGDTVNLASRLSSQAKPDEILIDSHTCKQVEGYFECEYMETKTVKGKADPVQVHRVLFQRDRPITVHRVSGLRADLIGRKVQMVELFNAVDSLRQGEGRIFSISGAAGTGKSRLIEEFKARLDLEQIQWIEGHAYAYSQSIPYFPLVDLLNRLLHIEEKDSPEKVREKVETWVESLVGKQEYIISYLGGLYSLNYPLLENVSPEFWKSRLQAATLEILSSLAKKAPTIFFLEDLHWADPSFVELLRRACIEIRQPAIVLCTYRTEFSLFNDLQQTSTGKYYREIQLKDLSQSEAQDMLESLLETNRIPLDLKRWVQKKAEGNPFYLEELVNTLIESETLKFNNDNWELTRAISESYLSSSLNGLISSRLDRLEKQTKRILQEASVIGRDFFYIILKKITELEERIDLELRHLERLDLIRTRSLQPDLEYMFKHALTQEIAYNSLLKKDRREIHEQIARVIESIFKDRLAEFYETLAFHFSRGQSVTEAVDYLVKSGEKSLARYAVEEAHQYFKKAFEILAPKENKSETEKFLLIDILNSWAYAFYYLGEFKDFIDIFSTHQSLVESMDDNARTGMFYAWFGIAHYMAGKSKDSYEYLRRGLNLGEKACNQKVVGYACAWLPFVCAELGLLTDGIGYGERAQKIAESFDSDQYLFFKSLAGLCVIYFFKGDTNNIFKGAKRLLEYAETNANSRSRVFGHYANGFGHLVVGDIKASQNSFKKAIEVALDPLFSHFPKGPLGLAYLLSGQLQEAENVLQSCINFCDKRELGEFYVTCQFFLAPILIAFGQMQQGTDLIKNAQKALINNQRRAQYALSEHIFGEVYAQIATGPKPSLSIMVKNIVFLLKNVPFAAKKAEEHFNKAIYLLKQIDGKGLLGTVYLSKGLLYKKRRKTDKARECILEAINIFQECGAVKYLEQSNEALNSL